jgi:hypothetical protein
MSSALSDTSAIRLTAWIAVVIISTASAAWGQPTQDFLSHLGTLTLNDGTPATGHVSIAHDTAAVGNDGVVHVFRRPRGSDQWLHTATLTPSDGTSGFGGSVAVDGRTIVVGASGAAFVFARRPGVGWQEVKKLTGDTNPVDFGRTVSVSGTTVVVGAPAPASPLPPVGGSILGIVYVFERDRGGPDAWGKVAKLEPPAPPPAGNVLFFGPAVSIDGDTLIVGSLLRGVALHNPFMSQGGYIFSRDSSGVNGWSLSAVLSLGSFFDSFGGTAVSISRDTVVIANAFSQTGYFSRVFQRDPRQPNSWALVATRIGASSVDVDRNLLVTSTNHYASRPACIFARNQGAKDDFRGEVGGKDPWGEVACVSLTGPLDPSPRPVAVVGGDTVFLSTSVGNAIEMYVVDTDRDGLRDGADPCLRDPLNNVAGGCQRASTVHPVLDELIAQGDVTSETRGRQHIITATFTNTSDTAVRNPFFEVTELTGGNVLLNGDAGRGGIGATLSPDVGDGVLSPGESMTATFRIRLRSLDPFQFFVSFHGDAVP